MREEDNEDFYDHLVGHLVEQDTQEKDTNMWTRVFAVDRRNDRLPGIYPIGADLIYDRSVRDTLTDFADVTGEVIFSPFMFKKADVSGRLEDFAIPCKKLLAYGQVTTNARKALDELVLKRPRSEQRSPSSSEETKLDLKRAYSRKKIKKVEALVNNKVKEDLENTGLKRVSKSQLTASEIEAVIRSVKEDKFSHREAT